ncbi:tetratricopeptide repeat protein [Myxococcus faecalis]|uniref:tetratricopeptide repeat protein n=1 Tax=Myxococcus faecalis TaxID=3115646 RepID=UPI003CEA3447
MGDEHPLRIASELARAGRIDEAISCLEAALERARSMAERPANTSLLARTAGLLCEEAGRLPQAARYYEEALAVAAEREPLLLLALAEVHRRSGQVAGAQVCLDEAEALARGSAEVDVALRVAQLGEAWARDER